MLEIDTIILSHCQDEYLTLMTKQAIESLMNSESNIKFNLVIVETNGLLEFEGLFDEHKTKYDYQIIYPRKSFNYNEFLQIGYEHLGGADHILILNNDVICKSKFANNLVEHLTVYDSVSPRNPNSLLHKKSEGVIEGYRSSYQVCGWALMFNKSVLNTISFRDLFPKEFKFWYQDNYYAHQLQKNGFKHALVCTSEVIHIENQSHALLTNEEEMTTKQYTVYKSKIDQG